MAVGREERRQKKSFMRKRQDLRNHPVSKSHSRSKTTILCNCGFKGRLSPFLGSWLPPPPNGDSMPEQLASHWGSSWLGQSVPRTAPYIECLSPSAKDHPSLWILLATPTARPSCSTESQRLAKFFSTLLLMLQGHRHSVRSLHLV